MAPAKGDMQDFGSFGAALRYYREHIAERIRRFVPGRLPDIQLTAKEVVSCMKDAGYSISQPAFSDIEQGIYLPKDPEEFMEKVILCLALAKDTPEYHNLMDHLVREVLRQRVGTEAADEYWRVFRSARQGSNQSVELG